MTAQRFEDDLTPREVELVALLSHGLSNKEIGRMMNISANTVKSHISRIGKALETPSRAGIVGECYRRQHLTIERDHGSAQDHRRL